MPLTHTCYRHITDTLAYIYIYIYIYIEREREREREGGREGEGEGREGGEKERGIGFRQIQR